MNANTESKENEPERCENCNRLLATCPTTKAYADANKAYARRNPSDRTGVPVEIPLPEEEPVVEQAAPPPRYRIKTRSIE